MTEEVMSVVAGTPSRMYAVSTEPAIVANPEVIVRWISDGVIMFTERYW